jgi:hypothetical protein
MENLPDEYTTTTIRRLAVSYFISLVNYNDLPHVEFVIVPHGGENSLKISFTLVEWTNIVEFIKERESLWKK